MLPTTQAFEQCTACSKIVSTIFFINLPKFIFFYLQVLDKYANDPNFLDEVFNSASNYLEDLTGLSALHSTALELEVMELSDDESF